MAYPAAPWQIQGDGLQTLHWIDIDHVRALIPAELAIVPFFPGKTIGGVYIASYGPGCALQYNELIVVSAVVYHAGKLGAWISHIYVDHPDSMAGGRAIWGLPKQLAEFTWNQDNTQVQIHQGDRLLCTAKCKQQSPGVSLPIQLSVFSTLNDQLIEFKGTGKLTTHAATITLQVPPESPFSYLNLDVGHWSFNFSSLRLNISAPSIQN